MIPKVLRSFTITDFIIVLLVSGGLIFLDQLIKMWMINKLMIGDSYISILPFLEFRLAFNSGVSFSILNNLDYRWLLLISFVSYLIASYMIFGFYNTKTFELYLVICLIMAGAFGNLIDRYEYKYVVDYIHLYYNDYSFPIFNLADCMITICATIIIKNIFFKKSLKD